MIDRWNKMRNRQRKAWQDDPRERRWQTPAGNIWYWNEHGMGLGAPIESGDSLLNHVDMTPADMNIREVL